MMGWALPTAAGARYASLRRELKTRGELERYRPFVRGGTWENFFVKYPESNQMHKRMLLVSERLAAAEAAGLPNLSDARRELFRSQGNCPYWHGLFGGVYVNYLRHAMYAAMIRADRLLDAATGDADLTLTSTDYDRDGYTELVLASPLLGAIIAPARGGALVELDWKPGAFNVLDTVSRKREAYHEALVDTPGDVPGGRTEGITSIHDRPKVVPPDVLAALVYDRHLRHSFLDHFWRDDVTLEQLERGGDTDLVDLGAERYTLRLAEAERGTCAVELEWSGDVLGRRVTLAKSYRATAAACAIEATYRLAHAGRDAMPLWFAVELNVALLAGDAPDRYYVFDPATGSGATRSDERPRLASRGIVGPLAAATLVDEWARLQVSVSSSRPFTLWRFPVETVSQSESGYERTYQESALYCHWSECLQPGVPLELTLRLGVSSLPVGDPPLP
jgi:alpha-amylase